jgi:hypothetical protein
MMMIMCWIFWMPSWDVTAGELGSVGDEVVVGLNDRSASGSAVGVAGRSALEKEHAQITRRVNRYGIILDFLFIGTPGFHYPTKI